MSGPWGGPSRVRLVRSAMAWAGAFAAAAAACSDTGPVAGPGTRTARLVSPHGAEGAAVLLLVGSGLGAVESLGETDVYRGDSDGKVRVALIDLDGGELAFRLHLADTTAAVAAVVEQVAGPDDELRTDLAAYRVELGP